MGGYGSVDQNDTFLASPHHVVERQIGAIVPLLRSCAYMEFPCLLCRIGTPGSFHIFGRASTGLMGHASTLAQHIILRAMGNRRGPIRSSRMCSGACVLDYGTGWQQYLPMAELAYNNSFEASIKKAPFEALYGRKCRSPLRWSEVQMCYGRPRRK